MTGYWRWAWCVAFFAGCPMAADVTPSDVGAERQREDGDTEPDARERDAAPRPAPDCDSTQVQDAHERSVARALETSCRSDEDCILTERFTTCVGRCSIAIPAASLATFEAAQAADVEPHCKVLQEAGCTMPPPVCESVRAACIDRRCSSIPRDAVRGPMACPVGTTSFSPGCATPEPTWPKGCYAACSDAAVCAPGYTCQETWVDPCVPKPGETVTCAACGQLTRLCLAAPTATTR